MFVLFNIIFGIILSVVDSLLIVNALGFTLLSGIYSLALIIPSIAVSIRRLHDIGKSGWWLFISLIPIAGPIWLLVLMFIEGTQGTNQYGENPKQA